MCLIYIAFFTKKHISLKENHVTYAFKIASFIGATAINYRECVALLAQTECEQQQSFSSAATNIVHSMESI